MSVHIRFDIVDIEGDAQALGDGFAELVLRADKEALHADIGEHMLNATDARFEAERAPDGTRWAPNSPATLISQYTSRGKRRKAFKQRAKGGDIELTAGFGRFVQAKRILQDKGVRGGLRGDISYEADGRSVRLGASKVYARIHQLGGTAGRGVTLPARPFLGLSRDDRQVIADIIVRWARESI
ncbi:MAG: phage virion morphogenesis protein [Bacteroidota bacterium]